MNQQPEPSTESQLPSTESPLPSTEPTPTDQLTEPITEKDVEMLQQQNDSYFLRFTKYLRFDCPGYISDKYKKIFDDENMTITSTPAERKKKVFENLKQLIRNGELITRHDLWCIYKLLSGSFFYKGIAGIHYPVKPEDRLNKELTDLENKAYHESKEQRRLTRMYDKALSTWSMFIPSTLPNENIARGGKKSRKSRKSRKHKKSIKGGKKSRKTRKHKY